jgi:hypothetical protein
MQEAIERLEIVEALLRDDRAEVKFDIALAADEGAVAQQAQTGTVRHHAPDVLGAVQILLNQRVRRQARPAGRRHPAQFLTGADDVHRRRVRGFVGAIENPKALAVDLLRARIVLRLVAEQTEQRDRPEIAGLGGCRVVLAEAIQTVLEYTPEGARVGEGCGDLVGQVAAGVEPEVGRALARQLAGEKLIEDFRAEQAALDADRRKGSHVR